MLYNLLSVVLVGRTRVLSYFYFYFFNLKYNCFTMLCEILLYNAVTQLYIYIYIYIHTHTHTYPLPLEFPSHPTSIPPHLDHRTQSIKLSSLCYTAVSH